MKKRETNISKIFPPGDLLMSKGQAESRECLLFLSDYEETWAEWSVHTQL